MTEGGNGLHFYAEIGNDFLMEGNMMLLQKLILNAKRANRQALFFGEDVMAF